MDKSSKLWGSFSTFWDLILFVPACICLMTVSLGAALMTLLYSTYAFVELSRELNVFLLFGAVFVVCLFGFYSYLRVGFLAVSQINWVQKKSNIFFGSFSLLITIGLLIYLYLNEILMIKDIQGLIFFFGIIFVVSTVGRILQTKLKSEVTP
jgi:uncharacterized membrane protein YesL